MKHIIVLLTIGLLTSCASIPKPLSLNGAVDNKPDKTVETTAEYTIKYYSSFNVNIIRSKNWMPYSLVGLITEEEAKATGNYMVGYYDSKNFLVKVERYLDNELFFRQEYTYYSNGNLKEKRGLNGAGILRIHYYDEAGNLVDIED